MVKLIKINIWNYWNGKWFALDYFMLFWIKSWKRE